MKKYILSNIPQFENERKDSRSQHEEGRTKCQSGKKEQKEETDDPTS